MNLESRISSELWSAVRLSYEGGNYTAAILDAIYMLSDVLRAKSGLEGDGAALVGQALGGSQPLIRVSKLQSESDWNVQRGMEQLLRGLYQAIRNPRSHGKVADVEGDAQALILFVDYILRVVGASKTPFSLPEYVERVLDKDFVAQERYASLLVEKLPPKYRLEVFYETFRRRDETKGDKLRAYYSALLPLLTPEEREEVARTLSAELEVVTEESEIISAIDVIGRLMWNDVDELARIRVENRLLDSVRSGSFSLPKKRCESGALGTWASGILSDIAAKKELGSVLIRKLETGNPNEREYVYQFFCFQLDKLYDKPPKRLQDVIVKLLSKGDERLKDTLDNSFLWGDVAWGPAVVEAIASFVPAQPDFNPFDSDEDDLPF